MNGKDMVYQKLGGLFCIDMLRDWEEDGVATESVQDDKNSVEFFVGWDRAKEIDGY
jgi:hypothetical protein